MGDPDFRPHPHRITEDDIFLVYAAFQRAIHHFNILQDTPDYHNEAFYKVNKKIFKYIKNFCKDKRELSNTQWSQQASYYSVFDVIFGYVINLMTKKQEFEGPKYLVSYDEWEKEFDKHADKFPTHRDVSNAHVHAVDKHVTDLNSKVSDKGYSKFDSNKMFHSFEACTGWMSSPLKEAVLSIPPDQRLIWCARLLVAYHYETECDMFMSTAFKLGVNMLNLTAVRKSKSAEDLCRKVTRYLNFFENLRLDAPTYREKLIDKCTDFLFFAAPENFRILIKYGANYGYSKEHLAALKWWMTVDMRGMCRIHPDENTSPKCEFYCLQIFYLYVFRRRPYVNEELQAIWFSISEPFISEEDIYACFCHMENDGGYEWFSSAGRSWTISDYAKKVHLWYCTIVGAEGNNLRSPRRLQHLSRCVIRTHLRFPINVDALKLPQKFKDYLMLKK